MRDVGAMDGAGYGCCERIQSMISEGLGERNLEGVGSPDSMVTDEIKLLSLAKG